MELIFQTLILISNGAHKPYWITSDLRVTSNTLHELLDTCIEKGLIYCEEHECRKRGARLSNNPASIRKEYYPTEKGRLFVQKLKEIREIWRAKFGERIW